MTSSASDRSDGVATLMAMTSMSSGEAQQLLDSHHGDVEKAVHTWLAAHERALPRAAASSSSSSSSSHARAQVPTASRSGSSRTPGGAGNRINFAQQDDDDDGDGLVEDAVPTASEPPTQAQATGFGARLFGVVSKIPGAGLVKNALSLVGQTFLGTGGAHDADRAARELKETHMNCPDFCECSYEQAIQRARSQGKLLFIYLHSYTHHDTEAFVRDTLCSESVSMFLNENFVSWLGDVRLRDPYILATEFNAAKFPFMCVLVCENNSMALVYRHAGPIESDELLTSLVGLVDGSEQLVQQLAAQDPRARQAAHHSAHHETRSIREQQDWDYQMALARDRERRQQEEEEHRQIQAALEAERERIRLEEQAERERIEEEQRLEEERLAKRLSLPDEPPPGSNTITVGLRLPDGTKVTRRFLSSDTMALVFGFVDSHKLVVGDEEVHEYQIVQPYPRKVFDDEDAVLGDMGLGRQCMLLVQEVHDDDDDDEDDDDD